MRRIVYISGKYRHYFDDGSLDMEAMKMEVEDEQDWCRVVAEAGMMWVGPLSNSEFMEGEDVIPSDAFVERDCELIARLKRDWDCLLLRPGWDDDPPSHGATIELAAAQEAGLIVVHGLHGKDMVQHYLETLNGVAE